MSTAYADTLASYGDLLPTKEAQLLLEQHKPCAPINGRLPNGAPIYQAAVQPLPSASHKISTISAGALCIQDFDPLFQPVQGLICEGLTLFAGASKVGKSWAVLDMCLSVSSGQPFLGRKTVQCEVLYLALEDSERRLKDRIQKIGKPVTDALHLSTTAEMVGLGFAEQLESWMREHPETRLIVVDTFQKVRGVAPSRANAYQQDYQVMGSLKAFADKYRIALVLVHHLNKLRAVEDVYDKISGSTGLMGAADTTILIERKRESSEATVHFTGRDVWDDDFIISLSDGRWTVVTEDVCANAQKLAYQEQPMVQLCRAVIADFPAGKRMTYSEFLKEGYSRVGTSVAIDSRDLNKKLKDWMPLLHKYDGILIETGVRVGNGKGIKLAKATTSFPQRCSEQVSLNTE